MSDEPASVGTILRTAREHLGLSVADVAERTRIRATLIRDIEADDFSGCGDAFYARGHVRSIATTLGLDPRPLLEQFDVAQRPAIPQVVTQSLPAYEPALPKQRELGRAQRSNPNVARYHAPKPRWQTAMIVASAFVALLAIGVFVGLLGGSRPKTATEKPPVTATSSPSPSPAQPQPQPQPSRSGAVAQVPQSGVSLRVRVLTGATWIRVTDVSGRIVYEGVLTSGTVKDFQDPKGLVVRYGNAPAVSVIQNGKDLGSPSCGAQVCTMRYEPEQAAG